MTVHEQTSTPPVEPRRADEPSQRGIEQLTREHANIARLLEILESQLSSLGAGEDSDDRLMLALVTYLTDYVDGFHEAIEDLALRAAVERAPDLRAVAQELSAQHVRVREVGGELRAGLECALLDEPVRRQELATQGLAYTAELRGNMRLEEAVVFPALEETLDADTWVQIAAKLGERPDPLFGGAVPERYATLFRELACRCAG
jgi:hemerythrin-like domain-containing protein